MSKAWRRMRFLLFCILSIFICVLFILPALAQVKSEVEPNDKKEQAQEIRVGDSVEGFFQVDRDSDYFKFTLDGPGKTLIQVDLSAVPGVRTVLYLYNDRGVQIWEERGDEALSIFRLALEQGTYYVAAFNADRESATSFEVSAIPVAAPLIPTGVSAQEGDEFVTVTWTHSAGATSYNIYYGTSSSVSKKSGIKIAGLSGSSYTVRPLENKTPYYFVVTAVNAGGESGDSPWAMATPLAQAPQRGLVRIPAGPFQMGDNLDKTGYVLPVHTVNLDEFYIDRYETMYTLWKEVHDWAVANGYKFDSAGQNGSFRKGNNLPVTMVSWYDSVKWLNARSEKEGRTPVYYVDDAHTNVYRTGRVDLSNSQVKWEGDGYRLPTEAEWEKAARGGVKGQRYPWGDELGTGNANDNMGGAVPVGIYQANGYGLYDMAGNVFEWVWDWGSERQAYDWAVDGAKNPRGPESSDTDTRIRRGGGYTYGSQQLKCSGRMFRVPTYTAPYFGFRSAARKR
jgi:formylglycine-generating enzyme required for sulfatase activity